MRRCRKMISLIMLMVMLVSLLPSGAMAAEAPTGATNEIAAVEEPQNDTDVAENTDITNVETDKSEEDPADTSVSDVNENEPTEGDVIDVVPADEDPTEGITEEDAGLGNTSTEIAAEEEPADGNTAEDAGLGNTSTETAAVVEPTDQTVKKEEKAASGANLWDYFAEHPEKGNLVVYVDGKEVTPDSAPIEIVWEKEYKIDVHLTAKGLLPETYTIDLPNVFTYTLKDDDGNIVNQVDLVKENDPEPIGYYEVEEHGPATLVLAQEMNTQQDLGYTLTFYCIIDKEIIEEIDWHGIKFDIDKPEGEIAIKKWNYYDLGKTYYKKVTGEDGKEVKHFRWRTEVQHDKWTTPEGCTFTDTLTNHNHKFTNWDMESGIEVTATKEGHADVTWTLHGDDITWSDYTWTYVIPASYNGTTFNEGGWKFQFDYWTTQVVKPTLSDKYYNNKSEYTKAGWTGSVIESDATLHQGAEGVRNFNKVGFPQYDGNLRLEGMKYIISSNVDVDPDLQYGYIDEIHYYSYPNIKKNLNIPDDINPGWTNINVKFTLYEKNGSNYDEIKTYENLPVVNAGDPAPAEADEKDGYYAVYIDINKNDDGNDPLGTYYGSKYRAVVIVNKNYEGDPEPKTGLGKSMLYGDRAIITLEYYQEHTPAFKEYLTGKNVYSLHNRAVLWRDHQLSSGDVDIVSYMGRSKTLLDPPTASNGNIAEFKVGFPISADVSESDEIYFVDEMLASNSFKLESITLQKFKFGHGDEFGGGEALGEPYAPDPADVTTELIEKDGKKYRQLRIKLDHEQVYYEITYKVRASTNEDERTNKGIPFDNTFWIEYGNYRPVPIPVPNARTDYSVFSQSYAVTIHKTNEAGSPLEGAEFNLYDEEGYSPIPKNVTYSTDESGDVIFSTNVENGILYDQNHPYYIMETKAPEGYEQDNTKHWFVIDDDTFPAYDYEGFFRENGIKDYKVIDGKTQSSVTIDVVNKQSNIEIPVEKTWNDKKNQHDSVTVKLYAGDKDTGKTLVLNEENSFKGKFTDLAKTDASGKTIVYTVKEVTVPGYKVEVTGSAAEGFKITNTPIASIAVEKIWNDVNNKEGKRPTSLTVYLTKNGSRMTGKDYSVTLNETGGWKHTWPNLPLTDKDGNEITYSVEEDAVTGYTAGNPVKKSETTDEQTGVTTVTYAITNTYVPKTEITVKKVWDDADDQDCERPNGITVYLTKDGKKVEGSEVDLDGTIDDYETEEWQHTWKNLDKYTGEGNLIEYGVDEDTSNLPDTYSKTITPKGTVFTITNTNPPDKVKVLVTKKWEDNDNQDGLRTTVSVQLMKDGKSMGDAYKADLTVEKGWKKEWTDLDKINRSSGDPIKYSVQETVTVDGYTTTYSKPKLDGDTWIIDVINTHTPATTNIYVEKEWDDKNNQDGKRPESIYVGLIDSDAPDKVIQEAELSEEKGWNYTFTDLPQNKKVGEQSVAIQYDVKEYVKDETGEIKNFDSGYILTKTPIAEEDLPEGVSGAGFAYHLKNSYEPEKINVSARKVWDDCNDMDKKRPDRITLQLLADGELCRYPVTLSAEDAGGSWSYTWTELPRYRSPGIEIEYTVDELSIPEGYEKSIVKTVEGALISYAVTNKHKERPVAVSKVDITSEGELEGATLQVLTTDEDGKEKVVEEWVSGKEPHIIYGLTPDVEYTLRETVAPGGYTITSDTKFTLDEFGKATSSGTTSTDENGLSILVVEDAKTKVSVSKVDTGAGEELPGAQIQIIDEEGKVVEEWTSTTEPHVIEGLLTNVKYILREKVAPLGYTLTTDTTFTIDEHGKVTSSGTTSTDENGETILVIEDTKTKITVSKVDTGAGKELPGAKIQIIDKDGKVVEEWTSTTEPHVIEGLLTNEKYILREKVAPLGYTLTSDTTFTIDEYGKVTSSGTINKEGMLVIEDTMTEVDILKVDSKTGKGLKGAKLQVLDDNGVVCEEWTSTKDAHKIKGLYTGVKYTLHEVEAPKGYDKAKDITFTIDTAGKVSSDALENGVVVMKDTPTPSKSKNKTGDEANGALWALLLLMAGGALGGTVWFKRKKRV